MEVWWSMGGKGWIERGEEGCWERDMYVRGYTWHILWEKGSRWRDSDIGIPMHSDMHTYSWPPILVHKKYNYKNLSHQNLN